MNKTVTFTINGKEYTLYFGMAAVKIYTLRLATELAKLLEALPKGKKPNVKELIGSIGSVKSFSYIIYGGWCNHNEMKEIANPEFEEVYLLTEEVMRDEKLAIEIETAFVNSRATQEQLDKLGVEKKTSPENTKPKTGMKSRRLPLAS